MKVLLINDYNRGGGAEDYLHTLRSVLTEGGHDVQLLCWDNSDDSADWIHNIPYNDATWRRGASRYLPSTDIFSQFNKAVSEIDPDVVHIHKNFNRPLQTLRACRGYPTVKTVHDFGIVSYTDLISYREIGTVSKSVMHTVERLFRPVLRREQHSVIDTYVSPSKALKSELIEAGYDGTVQIPYTVGNIEPSFGGAHILFAGRLSQEKGLFELVRGYSESTVRLPLKIAGRGPIESKLRETISQLDDSRIELVGYLSDEALEQHYRDAAAVVFPSKWRENYPVAAVEALAYGCGLLVSDKGGLPEFVTDGKNGWVFTSGDASAVTEAMQRLADIDFVALGQSSRELYDRKHAPATHLRRIESLYQSVL